MQGGHCVWRLNCEGKKGLKNASDSCPGVWVHWNTSSFVTALCQQDQTIRRALLKGFLHFNELWCLASGTHVFINHTLSYYICCCVPGSSGHEKTQRCAWRASGQSVWGEEERLVLHRSWGKPVASAGNTFPCSCCNNSLLLPPGRYHFILALSQRCSAMKCVSVRREIHTTVCIHVCVRVCACFHICEANCHVLRYLNLGEDSAQAAAACGLKKGADHWCTSYNNACQDPSFGFFSCFHHERRRSQQSSLFPVTSACLSLGNPQVFWGQLRRFIAFTQNNRSLGSRFQLGRLASNVAAILCTRTLFFSSSLFAKYRITVFYVLPLDCWFCLYSETDQWPVFWRVIRWPNTAQ